MTTQKIARNDPCPCGSGKKYKQCCLLTARQPAPPASAAMDLTHELQRASAHYQAGQWREADAVCQQILQRSPNHPDALHMQGMIAYRIGMLDVAAVLLGSVAEIAPDFADGHNNLGVVLITARPSRSRPITLRCTATWAMRCRRKAGWTRRSPATARPSGSIRIGWKCITT
ncbi:MAG: SEC-C domain-containing protein [Thiobacillus sp.]|nr:SEC-C domain-containing protein [Thiobacillus sp.]